ncbi:hypothetical protein [Streptomyces sp. NPDC001450]
MNTVRQLGYAPGVAVFGTVPTARTTGTLPHGAAAEALVLVLVLVRAPGAQRTGVTESAATTLNREDEGAARLSPEEAAVGP